MENTRFLLYILVLIILFLILGAIKSFLPHPKPAKQVDFVGIDLFKPVLYGSLSESRVEVKKKNEESEDVFVDIEENTMDEENTSIPERETVPVGAAVTNEQEYFSQLLNEYKQEVLKNRRYRNDVVVRYYKHSPDGDKANVLVDYGFYLHVRPVSDSGRYESTMSNVIYYGEDFPKSDLKLITYLLVSNGIGIKEIRRFKDFDGWKRNSIEIGGDPKLTNSNTLTFQAIRNLE